MDKKIKLLVMDVDGTLTDGKLYIGENGEVFKAFNVKDGCGIKDILPMYGIKPVIITARRSKILEKRCEELNIDMLFQGKNNKLECLKRIAAELGIDSQEIAYIGDDITDLECIRYSGLSACPADAVKVVKDIVDIVCKTNAGSGAVREFIEKII